MVQPSQLITNWKKQDVGLWPGQFLLNKKIKEITKSEKKEQQAKERQLSPKNRVAVGSNLQLSLLLENVFGKLEVLSAWDSREECLRGLWDLPVQWTKERICALFLNRKMFRYVYMHSDWWQ